MSEEIDYKSAYESVLILKDMLIKENQQLKEDKIQLEAKLDEANDIIDIEMELRDFWIDKYHEVRQVLDEIREYIEKETIYNNYNEVYRGILDSRNVNHLLQILDKVKE